MDTLLTGLISSKTRVKLLVRLFINPGTQSYLRQLSNEFGVSTNSVREELNQLSSTKLVTTSKEGRRVYYRANNEHPLYPELKSMVSKVLGVDQVIDGVIKRLGDLKEAYLIDDYAEGKDTGIIDLLLVGNINNYHLNDLTRKTERYIKRKIRPLVLNAMEFKAFHEWMAQHPHILLWRNE